MNLKRKLRSLKALARALSSPRTRTIVREAWRLEQMLPYWFEIFPLPQLMRRLDQEADASARHADATSIVRCADAVVLLDIFSPLGVCLRRSLVRYVLLRRAGSPVTIHFGAKKNVVDGRGKIAGHAWLTLSGQPFAENPQDYEGFTSIYTYPASGSSPLSSPVPEPVPHAPLSPSPVSNR